VGWASARFAERAEFVLGIDASEEAIELAGSRYVADNLEFRAMDCLDLSELAEAPFDVVCSFESLEHFDRADGIRYVKGLARMLRPGGVLVGSTPSASDRRDAEQRLGWEKNEFHKYIWAERELKRMLQRTFSHVWVCNMPEKYFLFWAQRDRPLAHRALSSLVSRLRRLGRGGKRRLRRLGRGVKSRLRRFFG